MDISIIISSWNTSNFIKNCLNSLEKNAPNREFEIIVIDNASTDGTVDMLGSLFPDIHLIRNSNNVGFGAANNQGAKIARGKYFLLLNADTLVHPGAIQTLADYLDQNFDVAAVGPKLLNEDGSLQISTFRSPTLFNELWRMLYLDRFWPVSRYPIRKFNSTKPIDVEILNGACILIRSDVVEKLGLFDEDFFMYSEEVDLCERIRKKHWKIRWEPRAEITHFGGKSTSQVAETMFLELYRNKIRFFRKHRGNFQAFLYKIILASTAFIRIATGKVLVILNPSRKQKWMSLSDRYTKLMRQIRGM